MRTLRTLAIATAVAAYVVVALSPLVRITGSGLGCGEHWPLCNGHLIPPLDNPQVMIEWGHRLAAATLSLLIVLLVAAAWRRRHEPGVGGAGGVLRPALLAGLLLVVQVLLGAVTVWFSLPPSVVVVHLGNAMALLAAVVVAALRTGGLAHRREGGRLFGGAVVAAGLGGAALLLGALTANLGAGTACRGFPLCNGRLWPVWNAGGLAVVHWIHRLVAYALFLHLVGMAFASRRLRPSRPVARALTLALGLLIVHVTIAAFMVLDHLPTVLRATHAALGAAVWVTLIVFAWTAAAREGDASGVTSAE